MGVVGRDDAFIKLDVPCGLDDDDIPTIQTQKQTNCHVSRNKDYNQIMDEWRALF